MVNTRSTTRNQPSRLTPSVMARRQRNSPQPIQNPPFRHRYDNPPKRPSNTPGPSHTQITEVNPGDPDPDPGPPDDEGDGDDNDGNNSNPGSVHTPVPEPGSEPEPKDMGKVLAKAMTCIAEFVNPDKCFGTRQD